MTKITATAAAQIAAAAEVLVDVDAITREEGDRLASIARTRRTWPSEAALVAMALESYADAHEVAQ